MNNRLYVVYQEYEGEEFMSPCVGDQELECHAQMVDEFGCSIIRIEDLEGEVTRLVRDCYLEGTLKHWWLYMARDA